MIAPRTDPHERSLAHAALISDEWRRSGQEPKDEAHEERGAIVRLVSGDAPRRIVATDYDASACTPSSEGHAPGTTQTIEVSRHSVVVEVALHD